MASPEHGCDGQGSVLPGAKGSLVDERQPRHPGRMTTAESASSAQLPARLSAGAEMSLAWRIVLLNSAVLWVACLALALGPATVSTPVHLRELFVLLLGLVATMGANVVLVRRAFGPLQRLTSLMRTVDPLALARACRRGAPPKRCASWPVRSMTCSTVLRPSAATVPAGPCARRRRSAGGWRASCTTSSANR
jgi:hypothetical protein